MDLTARGVPYIRRELVDWYEQYGTEWFETMIEFGKQPIRPVGPSDQAARFLAAREREALHEATLWFVDGDTCDLVNGAHGSMPPFAPVASDLPSRYGFTVFQRPIMDRATNLDRGQVEYALTCLALLDANPGEQQMIRQVRDLMMSADLSIDEAIRSIAACAADPARSDEIRMDLRRICQADLHDVHDVLAGQDISIKAVSWGPAPVGRDSRAPAGGVWMSFYSLPNMDAIVTDPVKLVETRRFMASLMIDNEVVVPWYPGEGDRDQFVLPETMELTSGWARLVFATFRLAAQRGLCEQMEQRTERAERRRTERAGLPARDVTVVRLRGAQHSSGGAAGSGVRHGHRYPVRGHWRNQWYPSVEDHRPIWIEQHIRGPEGTELRGGERVTVV